MRCFGGFYANQRGQMHRCFKRWQSDISVKQKIFKSGSKGSDRLVMVSPVVAFNGYNRVKDTLDPYDIDTYTYGMKIYFHMGRHDMVEDIYRDISEHGLAPDLYTHNIFISSLFKTGKYEEVIRYTPDFQYPVNRLQKKLVHNKLLAYFNLDMPEEALSYCKRNDLIMDSTLSQGFLIVNDIQKATHYFRLSKVKNYESFIKSLLNCGAKETALSHFFEAVDMNLASTDLCSFVLIQTEDSDVFETIMNLVSTDELNMNENLLGAITLYNFKQGLTESGMSFFKQWFPEVDVKVRHFVFLLEELSRQEKWDIFSEMVAIHLSTLDASNDQFTEQVENLFGSFPSYEYWQWKTSHHVTNREKLEKMVELIKLNN
eukprot:TRINITY_DN6883_c0_g1_i1.p1 TRINITY_DN6883_c0_g1~~TRINITY_DN6883_c0_g1_i1.p1  ORF type:complete len:373 (-),score=60.43 TRINITY_DN6883_c0_g1_i1:5-1123(-)